jgi:hypothetical protein
VHLREDAGIKPGSVRVCVDRDEHLSGERIGDSLLKVITGGAADGEANVRPSAMLALNVVTDLVDNCEVVPLRRESGMYEDQRWRPRPWPVVAIDRASWLGRGVVLDLNF